MISRFPTIIWTQLSQDESSNDQNVCPSTSIFFNATWNKIWIRNYYVTLSCLTTLQISDLQGSVLKKNNPRYEHSRMRLVLITMKIRHDIKKEQQSKTKVRVLDIGQVLWSQINCEHHCLMVLHDINGKRFHWVQFSLHSVVPCFLRSAICSFACDY